MALGTVSRQVQRRVIGVCTLCVISQVARRALGRGALIAIGVAFHAPDVDMASCQGKIGGVVVKDVVCVARWVTCKASGTIISVAAHSGVLIIGLRIDVATSAGKYGIIRWVGVAVHTLCPNALMLPAVYRKILAVVVEGGWCPGVLSVTGGAGERELPQQVIWIGGRIVIRLVATCAGIGRVVIITSRVAGGAIVGDGGVRSH